MTVQVSAEIIQQNLFKSLIFRKQVHLIISITKQRRTICYVLKFPLKNYLTINANPFSKAQVYNQNGTKFFICILYIAQPQEKKRIWAKGKFTEDAKEDVHIFTIK